MSEWPQHYILVDRVPFAVDMMTWARWFNDIDSRRVDHTDVDARCHVSTVFLGLDHNFSGGEPILFETMIFGGPLDGAQWRYHTYDQAERGHADAVAQARIACARVRAIADAAGAKVEG